MKRQANTLAAIINNFDIVEDAIESSTNSQGSALEENAKVLESIEGRITLFNNSIERFWNNLLDSDVIKMFVDLGTIVVETASKFGELQSVIFAILMYFNVSKKYPLDFYSWIFGKNGADGIISNVGKIKNALSGLSNIKLPFTKAKGDKSGLIPDVPDADVVTQQAEDAVSQYYNIFRNGLGKDVGELSFDTDLLNIELDKISKMDNTSVVEYMKSLGDLGEESGNTSKVLAGYVSTVKDGNYTIQGAQQYVDQHNASVKTSGITAKAAAVGHQLLNAAISMGISFLLSWAIEAVTKAINANKELAESVEEVMTEYNNATKTLKDHYDTIEEIEDDYKKLSKGVDNLGHNIGLSTDEYQRYNEIVNKIAAMFPEMVSGYTEEGNAIISLKGNVEALKDAYEDEAKAARSAILIKQNDIFNNFKNNTNKQKWSWLQLGKVSQTDKLSFFEAISSGTSIADWEKKNKQLDESLIDTWLEEAGITNTNWFSTRDDFDKAIKKNLLSVQTYYNSLRSQYDAEDVSIRPVINAYLEQDEGYLNLSDEGKNMAQSIISGFNTEFYSRFTSATEMEAWVTKNVIQPLQDVGNMMEFTAAVNLQTEFNNGTVSVDDYIKQIVELMAKLDELGFDLDVRRSVWNMFGIDDYNTKTRSAKDILDDDGDTKVGTLSKTDLDIIDKNKTAWKEEFGLDDNTLMSWDQLTAAIQKAKDKMEEASVTFSQLSEKVDGIQSAFDTLVGAQKEYNENGYFSVDTMQKLLELEPKYLDLLYDENGNINLNKQALLDVAKARIIDLGIKQKSVIVDEALSLSRTGTTADLLKQIEVTEQAIKSNDDYVESTKQTIIANLNRRKSEGAIDIDVASFMSGLNSQLDAVDKTTNIAIQNLSNSLSSSGNSFSFN